MNHKIKSENLLVDQKKFLFHQVTNQRLQLIKRTPYSPDLALCDFFFNPLLEEMISLEDISIKY